MKTIRPRIWVKTFQPEFESKIRAGEKVGTIRPVPSLVPTIGDTIDCRMWSGLPYRSKQVKIAEFMIRGVYPVEICLGGMVYENREKALQRTYDISIRKDLRILNQVAKGDGFESWRELTSWFSGRYQLPFRGIWIYWGPIL